LAFWGGQLFFPDELRYDELIWRIQSKLPILAKHPPHPGYWLLMYPVAWFQSGLGHLLHLPNVQLFWVPAIVNAVASVGVIAVVYGIAHRLGGEPAIASTACFFASASAPMLYYCRHLLPYDAALALVLLGLYVALDPALTPRRSVLAGLAIGSSALVYNGGASFVAIIALWAVWHLRRSAIHIGAFFAGLLAVPVAFFAIAGKPYFDALVAFNATVHQGWFMGRGRVLPVAGPGLIGLGQMGGVRTNGAPVRPAARDRGGRRMVSHLQQDSIPHSLASHARSAGRSGGDRRSDCVQLRAGSGTAIPRRNHARARAILSRWFR
jgi:hypothetical protein